MSIDAKAKAKTPRQEQGDDYVLVDESLQDSESNQVGGWKVTVLLLPDIQLAKHVFRRLLKAAVYR